MERLSPGKIQPGDTGEETLSIGVHGPGEKGAGLGLLHNLAQIHHPHTVAELGHGAQVVGDEEHRHAQFLIELGDQVQNLFLDGHVQGGGGLVGNEQAGFAGKGHGDHHPLLHSAREFVGVLAQAALRAGNAHQMEQLLRPGPGLGLGEIFVEQEHLGELPFHRVDRAQRGEGVLKDDGDPVAPDLPQPGEGKLEQVLSLKENLPLIGDGRVIVPQAQDGLGHDALARARLAHHAHNLAGTDGQIYPVHRREKALAHPEENPQVLDFQQRFLVLCLAHFFRLPPVRGSR